MDDTPANPIWVPLLCVARCAIPLLVMLGISYLLKKFGLIAEPPQPPPDENDGNNNHNLTSGQGEGGMAHGKA